MSTFKALCIKSASKKILFATSALDDTQVVVQLAAYLIRVLRTDEDIDWDKIVRVSSRNTKLNEQVVDGNREQTLMKLEKFYNASVQVTGEPNLQEEDDDDTLKHKQLATGDSTTNYLQEVKKFLPSTRKRLSALRTTLDQEPTNDYEERADIDHSRVLEANLEQPTQSYTQERNRISIIDSYLARYHKRMRDDTPTPSIEILDEAISAVGTSAAGPDIMIDGIPFAAYKALRKA